MLVNKFGITASQKAAESSGRILAWEDDFDTLDTDTWDYELRDIRAGEIQYYVSDAKNVYVQDSILHLKAIKDNPIDGFEWSSGSIISRKGFSYHYGLLEARIKYDKQDGCWPAFWTKGYHYWRDFIAKQNLGVNWPECGEIDIVEFWPDNRYVPTTWFYKDDDGTTSANIGTKTVNWDNDWHIYGVERTPTEIKFYLDRVYQGTISIAQYREELFIPHTITLNLALGGQGGEVSALLTETEYQVDWVRYYLPEAAAQKVIPTVMTLDCGTTLGLNDAKRFLMNPVFNVDYPLNFQCMWTSSNPSVATCYAGTVKTLSNGTTTITATHASGLTASCLLTVDPSVVHLTESIEIYCATNSVDYGATLTLGTIIAPEYRSNTGVAWSSSDTAIATVENGVVTAVGTSGGTVTITCTSSDENASDTFEVICRAQIVDGLVASYDAALANGSGVPTNSPMTNPWVDLTGDFDGTLTNMAGTETDGWVPSDPSLYFDGSNGYVATSLDAASFPGNSFSIVTKILPKVSGGTTRRIAGIDRSDSTGNALFNLQYTSTNIFQFYVYNTVGGNGLATANAAFTADQEYLIVATFDHTTGVAKLYIDKTLQTTQGTVPGTRGHAQQNLLIGSGYYNDAVSGYYKGRMKTFKLYNKCLSQDEINALT